MHRHSISQTTLAEDIVADLIDLDEKLKLADVSDFADLAERMRNLGRDEFAHVISFASIALGLAPEVAPVEGGNEAEAVKE